MQTELNSVSGIPKFSLSRFIKDKLNSEILSPPESKHIYVLIRTGTLMKLAHLHIEVLDYHRCLLFSESWQHSQL